MKLKSKSKLLYAGFALALIVPAPSIAQEFECANHIEAAQDAIDAANDSMIGLKSDLHMTRGHILLDEAKMYLAGSEHNCKKPQHGFDRARAASKADAAKGYAEAALIYFKKFGTKQYTKR